MKELSWQIIKEDFFCISMLQIINFPFSQKKFQVLKEDN